MQRLCSRNACSTLSFLPGLAHHTIQSDFIFCRIFRHESSLTLRLSHSTNFLAVIAKMVSDGLDPPKLPPPSTSRSSVSSRKRTQVTLMFSGKRAGSLVTDKYNKYQRQSAPDNVTFFGLSPFSTRADSTSRSGTPQSCHRPLPRGQAFPPGNYLLFFLRVRVGVRV
jgi:hypothetical protein